ncbi:L-fucose:H+ symporter permease [Chryseobacterium indoltheticum]|uniref:L-fucose permease n=1 Tax=Chryseobacterium indoltheticum TaxID=254 RepID=A0A381FDI0_9FLAO|nr:L-fucose:H+ symporter permease [Chryseobacterium indoltheticum]AZA60271.1 L-fucose:H+ symporter permease [Chryseobacterium indoltheticum]SUX44553.1 L-fucose permease [Chryseobacterium indoltheticum]
MNTNNPEDTFSSLSKKRNYGFPLILITSLFFFWGFIHNLDPILIKHLRSAFQLNHFQASLVDSSVFAAYFLLAIPAGMIIRKYGYKTGILVGLFFFAVGCFMFVPAANTISYPFFLGALFILSCGLAILETAANPYITVLGVPEKATQRLNFAQSFNGLAASIAPIVGGIFILSEEPKSQQELAVLDQAAKLAYIHAETSLVKGPYIILGLIILLVMFLFLFVKLPEVTESKEKSTKNFLQVLGVKNVGWGVLAQFFYIGAQIYVFSFLLVFAEDAINMKGQDAKYYAGVAGFLFMIGRFAGTFFMKYISPQKLLKIYSVISIALTIWVIFGSGISTLYALVVLTFFMSIMFPTIFALGIEGAGAETKSASSLLIMSIVGGAIIPPIASKITDISGNIHFSYVIPLLCFIIVFLFSLRFKNKKLLQEN